MQRVQIGLFLLFSFCVLAAVPAARAAQYYVAPDGSDSQAGTAAAPWRTVQKAADTLQPGDTVIVGAGVYVERVATTRNGTGPAPITFRAEEGAVVNGFVIQHDYVVVDGFDVTGRGIAGFLGAFHVTKDSSHALIMNNTIHDATGQIFGVYLVRGGPLASQSADHCIIRNNTFKSLRMHMINMFGSYHLVEGNTFDTSNGYDAIRMFGRGNIVRSNLFVNISEAGGTGNHADIIQTFGENGDEAYDILFEGNLVRDCPVCQIGQMVQQGQNIRDWTFRNNVYARVGAQANNVIPGVKWYNNTFYRCTTNTGHVLSFSYSTNGTGQAFGAEVRNNMFIECGPNPATATWGWYTVNTNLTDFAADNNYVAGLDGATKSRFSEPHGVNGGSPQFLSAAQYDFRLRGNSPAIDRGAVLAGYERDRVGVLRPQGEAWDIGAYEYAPVPNPPQAFRFGP